MAYRLHFIACLILIITNPLIAAEPSTLPATQADGRRDLPAFGISVFAPSGWATSATSRDPKLAVAFFRLNPTPSGQQITAGMSVSIEPLHVPTGHFPDLISSARAFAEKQGGILVDGRLTLDGEPAAQIKLNQSASEMHYVQHVLAIRNNYIYFISLTLEPGTDFPNEWYDFVQQFRWIDIDRPGPHLQLSKNRAKTLDGSVELLLPVGAILMPTKDSAAAATYLIHNYKDDRAEFVAYLNLKPRDPNQSDEQLWNSVSSDIEALYGKALQTKQLLNPEKLNAPGAWTTFFEVQDDKRNFREKWGVIPVGPARILIVSFRIHGNVRQEDVGFYEQLSKEMGASIQVMSGFLQHAQ